MSSSVPATLDLHEQALKDVNDAIDQITFGVGREDAAREPTRIAQRPRFHHIIACDDDTPTSAAVLDWAAHLARLDDAKVTVASVAPPVRVYDGPLGIGGYWPGMAEECARVERLMREHSRKAANELILEGVDADAVTSVGQAAHELAEIARDRRADLLILGAKGGGPVSRVLLGSVAEGVSGRVDASILIARTSPKARRILAATDGSAESGHAVAAALTYATKTNADLIVQHVLEYEADPSRIPPDGHLKSIIEQMGLPTIPRVRYLLDVGRPAESIVGRAASEGCDLIVMGARGLGRVSGALLGSVSHRVANTAGTSVLLVRRPAPE